MKEMERLKTTCGSVVVAYQMGWTITVSYLSSENISKTKIDIKLRITLGSDGLGL